MFKKITSTTLTIAMVMTLMVTSTFAKTYSIRFSDVPETFWGYTAIMEMAERGVFSGTVAPVNGVGKFEPNADMSRAAWVKTMVAYLWPNEVKVASNGEAWYDPYVKVAKAHGLIKDGEIGSNMNAAMPRQEMAMVTVRAALAQGETVDQLVDISKIPDYNSIGSKYQEYVRQAVSLGLIAGVDSHGTFDGNGKLSRAAAATVAYRLMDKSARVEVEFANASNPNPAPTSVSYADTAGVAGSYKNANGKIQRPSKPTADMSESAAIDALNGFLFEYYGRQFFAGVGIANGPTDTGRFAVVGKEGGFDCSYNGTPDLGGNRFFVRVFAWRHSYDSDVATNGELNCVLEAFRYLSGDAAVGKALWNLNDYLAINGSAATTNSVIESFGFTITNETDDSLDLTMNGVSIHWLWSAKESYFYFNY